MKKILALTSFVAFALAFEAQALPSFPRDIACTARSGEKITLRSNNGFFSQAENGRYNVELLLDRGNGVQTFTVTHVNNEASRVRGTDEGVKSYFFVQKPGEPSALIHVNLEFVTQNGLATAIKNFTVVDSAGFEFENSATSSDGICEVNFYPQIEI